MKSILPLLLLGVIAWVLWPASSSTSKPPARAGASAGNSGAPTGYLYIRLQQGAAYDFASAVGALAAIFTAQNLTNYRVVSAIPAGGAWDCNIQVSPADELVYWSAAAFSPLVANAEQA